MPTRPILFRWTLTYLFASSDRLPNSLSVCLQSLLISAVVGFFRGRDGTKSPSKQPQLEPSEPPSRPATPVFVGGTLCECVHDEAEGNTFWICHDDISAKQDDMACRCVAKDGRWYWYCTQPQ